MAHEFVKVDRGERGVTVTLDRPGTRNACSMSMWLAIRDAFREIAASDARAVVLTGANGDFCSGADVVTSSGSEGFQGSHLTAMRLIAESVLAVHDCPIPVIVKVDGVSVGAGAGELDAAVTAVVGRIAAGPPIALSMTERMLDNAAASSLAQALETEAIAQNVNLRTQDMAEAFVAFREKRAPEFKGR